MAEVIEFAGVLKKIHENPLKIATNFKLIAEYKEQEGLKFWARKINLLIETAKNCYREAVYKENMEFIPGYWK
jgi:hypothetical protein